MQEAVREELCESSVNSSIAFVIPNVCNKKNELNIVNVGQCWLNTGFGFNACVCLLDKDSNRVV
jgi:hypothetical protein